MPLNLEAENPEEWQKEEQERIDTAEPLTEEQQQEKESLLQEGFSDWSRRDFNQFVRSCAEHGREDIDSICKEVEGKEPDEVGVCVCMCAHTCACGSKVNGINAKHLYDTVLF